MADEIEVLLVNSRQPSENKLKTALETAGFTTVQSLYSQLSQNLKSTQSYTILIFDASDLKDREQMETCLKLAQKIKLNPQTQHISLICIGICPNFLQEQQEHHFDDLIFGEIRIPSIISRVKAQSRLTTIHSELNRRNEISIKYNAQSLVKTKYATPINDASILITGRPNGYSLIEETLAPIATLVGTLSLETATEYMRRQSFDMVIINGGRMPTRFFDFVEQIKRDPQFFSLPVILVAYPSNLNKSHIAYEAGITDIIDAPINRNELILRTNSLIRERRFRSLMTQSYLDARHIPTNCALTGLFNHSFYQEHLAQTIKDHSASKRNFTIITIAVDNLATINSQFGFPAGDNVLRQVSEILMTIIRGEDLAARISGRKFTLTLPDTTYDDAANVLKRIEGVLKRTEFICETDCAPISVELAAEIIESKGETSPQELLTKQQNLINQLPEVKSA